MTAPSLVVLLDLLLQPAQNEPPIKNSFFVHLMCLLSLSPLPKGTWQVLSSATP